MPTFFRTTTLGITFIAIIGMQFAYDGARVKAPRETVVEATSPQFIRSFDLGLHSAAASFLWVNTIIELPFLQKGYRNFLNNLELINNLDPKFSFPYAFTTLVLPGVSKRKAPGKFQDTIVIAERGIREADPDWQIPFYLAVMYLVDLEDRPNAVKYFDIAAQTIGAPENIKSVSINFGTPRHLREEIKDVWRAIYESATDERTRERAQNYISRMEILDFLERAVLVYEQKTGVSPKTLDALVSEGIINTIPPDPFGFPFYIQDDGTVGVNKPEDFE